MKAFELFHKDGRSAGIWACGECRIVRKDKSDAELCCKQWKCQRCSDEVDRFRTLCNSCQRIRSDEKMQERLNSATLLEDHDGFVWTPALGYNDGYFDSVSELLSYCEDEELDAPEFVFACRARTLSVDVYDILGRLDEQGWEDMTEDAKGVEELSAAIDAFNAANAYTFKVWNYDFKHKVAVHPGPVETTASIN
ncbi:MAG: hypothetical protein Fues2KO_47460 [Fuerstiella sp.]